MPAQILDGKHIAADLIDSISQCVAARVQQGLAPPGLAMILVGDNAASAVYVRNKERPGEACYSQFSRPWRRAPS